MPQLPARTIDYWVAAVPVVWNIAPNGHDAIMGMDGARGRDDGPQHSVVYRRYRHRDWRKPLPNAPRASADGLLIPGPLIQARVGDRLRIHFKNMDTLRREPHSMHFHGVHYAPSSDGAYVPGFSGRDADVLPGQTYTYRLTAGDDSAGVWPYHDHSPSMMDSIEGGMYGMLSILGRHERAPDREFEVVFAPMGKFMTIDGRAFVGNTPVFHAKVGRPRAVGRDGDGLRLPHVPRPRPSLDHVRRRRARHADRRARPSPSASAGARTLLARGSTTATSRIT